MHRNNLLCWVGGRSVGGWHSANVVDRLRIFFSAEKERNQTYELSAWSGLAIIQLKGFRVIIMNTPTHGREACQEKSNKKQRIVGLVDRIVQPRSQQNRLRVRLLTRRRDRLVSLLIHVQSHAESTRRRLTRSATRYWLVGWFVGQFEGATSRR